MLPSDLGLPAKFASWRQGQWEAVVDIASRSERFIACAMPTGAGKSIFYVALHLLLQARTLVLTSTKGLENQLSNEFGEIGMVDVRGQSNYRCKALDDTRDMKGLRTIWMTQADSGHFPPAGSGCDVGPCRVGIDCPLRMGGCLYYDQVGIASKSRLVVTNYQYWMTQNRYGQQALGAFDMVVLDEAHEAADLLSSFCSVAFGREEVERLLGADMPAASSSMDTWITWASKLAIEAFNKAEQHKAHRSIHKARAYKDLYDRLAFLSAAGKWKRGNPGNPDVRVPGGQTDWVVAEENGLVTFSPVWAHGYAEEYLFAKIPKVVMVSATLMPGTLKYLGVQL